MSPEWLLEKAREQLDLMASIGRETAEVGFIVPGYRGLHRRVRLFPGGPLGQPEGHVRGGTMVFFDAHEVIAAIERMNEEESGG